MSFNKITIYGHVGKEPDLRYTPNGTPICNISVATSEKRKDEEITTWFSCAIFGRQAEVASQYLSKGSPVYLEGRLALEEWTDRDGKNRSTLKVSVTDLKLMGGKQEGRTERPADDDDDDGVPF